ncbi:DNA polymerase III subunit delta' [Corynebacterium aquilae]|uniref:DNA polymerase III subunit delta' n=1 Tax=Corynebacterium aquilae DSM 44791 TaxID=1431546 RepID=A0A1L7CDI5_9CORY|nr:DNA polymerase III subunit delta' [Corynebacterium aquilae]APT83884.1 DNA polymerase III subunit delta' [Corynebacterium aquilae DSM 44791]
MAVTDVFSTLADGGAVSRTLKAAATSARNKANGTPLGSAMTHSWLFTGPPGSGRSNAAVAFAQALVCTHPDTIGCGECEACRHTASNSHPDVTRIIPQELSIAVDAMRTVITEAAKLPSVAQWRVIIIEDADRLTESAANALLKTVEEPPERTVIILCAPSTDPTDIAVTLRSRCRHLYIPTPSTEAVADLLVRQGIANHQDALLAAAATNGHIGRAKRLATDPKTQNRRARILNLAELIYHGDAAFQEVADIVKAVEAGAKEELAPIEEAEIARLKNALGHGAKGKGTARAIGGTKSEITDLETKQKRRTTRHIRDSLDLALTDLAGLYRDALITNSGATSNLTHPDFKALSTELATKNTLEQLVACLDAISACRESFGHNVPPRIAMNAMVGRLRKACKTS